MGSGLFFVLTEDKEHWNRYIRNSIVILQAPEIKALRGFRFSRFKSELKD